MLQSTPARDGQIFSVPPRLSVGDVVILDKFPFGSMNGLRVEVLTIERDFIYVSHPDYAPFVVSHGCYVTIPPKKRSKKDRLVVIGFYFGEPTTTAIGNRTSPRGPRLYEPGPASVARLLRVTSGAPAKFYLSKIHPGGVIVTFDINGGAQ